MKQNFHLSLGYLGFCVLLTTACLPKTQFAQMVDGATSTSSFQVQTSYPDSGETLSNRPYLSGYATSKISYINFYIGTNCSGTSVGSGYRSGFMNEPGIQLTLNPSLSSYDLSAKITYTNLTTECLGKVFTYTKRSSNPVRLSSVSPSSPSNTTTPIFTGTLDSTFIEYVQLYSNATCTSAMTPTGATSPLITSSTFQNGVTLNLPPNATTQIYAKAFLGDDYNKTEAVPCLLFTSYTIDTTPSNPPVITNKFYYNSQDKSPIISWTIPNDPSGIKNYSYSIGTTVDLADIIPWTDTTLTSVQVTKTGVFTEGIRYYVKIKATDNALNTSTIGISSWIMKTNLPVLAITTPNANNVTVANLLTIAGTCISNPSNNSNPISFTTSEGVQSIANAECVNNFFKVQTKISAASGAQRSIVAIQSDGEINQSTQRTLSYAPLSSFGNTISAGLLHTCGTKDGSLYCWGLGIFGQLGIDSSSPLLNSGAYKPTLTSHSNLNRNSYFFEQIGTGKYHSCGLSTDRIAYCWGANGSWQLGNSLIFKPDDIVETNTGGLSSTLPLKVNMSQVEGGTFKQISVGGNHSCGLSDTNKVYCWGANGKGQIGNKPKTPGNDYIQRPILVSIGANVTQISAGDFHTCALTSAGDIWCWGNNKYSQLGDPTKTDSFYRDPVLVAPGGNIHPGEKFKYVSAGSQHTCAISTEEDVFCWGARENGALGISADTLPVTHPYFRVSVNKTINNISIPVKFKSLSAGGTISRNIGGIGLLDGEDPDIEPELARNQHTCAVSNEGEIYCWGQNNEGQLGINSTIQTSTPTKVVLSGLDANTLFSEVKTGAFHTCAKGIKNGKDTNFCWGTWTNGALGLGADAASGNYQFLIPTEITEDLYTQ